MPEVEPWIKRELKLIDPHLVLEWDADQEGYFVMSRRGREACIHGGPFGREHVNNQLVCSIRQAIRARDNDVSIYRILMNRLAARDRHLEEMYRENREWGEAQAERELDCATKNFRSYALGSPGAPAPPDTGDRIDGIRKAEE